MQVSEYAAIIFERKVVDLNIKGKSPQKDQS